VGHTIEFLLRHGYLVLFLWILGEQAGLPLPSAPLLLACGALARSGKLHLAAVLLWGVAACLIADNIWFQVGRRSGRRVLRLICRIALEPDSCVRRTEDAFVQYGLRSLLVSKFVPGLNAVAAPMAGVSGVRLGRFALFDSLGALIWVCSYACAGYLFSGQLEKVADHVPLMGSGLVALVLGLLAAWICWKYVQRRRFLRKIAIARITAAELRDKMEAGEDVMIVDLRSQSDHEETIAGALRISPAELAARHEEIPRDRDIVLFCS
jgi:membrane protein DedA with SNARE-associated domain